jgi:uncharacterized protein (TIGR00730 family)
MNRKDWPDMTLASLDDNSAAMQHNRMKNLTSLCVYCGSGPGSDPSYEQAAFDLGKAMAQSGIRLVYGGGNTGLMGTVARAVIDHGGKVTGIIPDFLKDREVMLKDADDMIVVADMHTRKQLMFDRSDAFVALPGGVGTLEELVEQLTWSQLGQHTKPILIADINGFWRPLLTLFAHMRNFEFIRDGFEVNYLVAEKSEDILPMLAARLHHHAGQAGNSAITEKL